jgi:large subunit ribosomal protein L4
MISVPVYNTAGQAVSTYEVDPVALGVKADENGNVDPRAQLERCKQLLHDAVVMYESNRRLGTAQTKGRSQVAGSKKKLYKQKGTGRARMGPKRSPIRRGGGHAHHKVTQDWTYRLPKKALRLATKMAVLSKFLDEQVTVLDQLSMTEGAAKTKTVATALKSLGLEGKTCLLTTAAHDPLVYRCSRNIEGVLVSPASDLNAYDVLAQRRLILTKAALDKLVGKEAV